MAISFQFLRRRPLMRRLDILVALVIYPLVLAPSVKLISEHWIPEAPTVPSNSTFAFLIDHVDADALDQYTFRVLAPVAMLVAHVLVYLVAYWSIDFRIKMLYSPASEADAECVCFRPKKHKGSVAIVKFHRGGANPFAVFQGKKRDFVDGKFTSLRYHKEGTVENYMNGKGWTTAEAKEAADYFGPNAYDIPTPGFLELLVEHMLAPFFVFQVFSILCWMLDEYWTYPLFSLISLVIMEANTVRTRQSNLMELRGVKNEAVFVQVYRDSQWKRISSELLVPGDLLLLTKPILAPCDMVVLSGRVVVNEAMLTGESTPQVKDAIQNLPKDYVVNQNRDKRHFVFGGTRIEQLLPEESAMYIPTPGCLCYATATGLGSSQGSLIRTILFASERVSAESKDSTKLLLFLTVFALGAASYVVHFCKGKINSYKLIVQALIIITSTIPPDLPMELTFSVNASLLALSKLSVFCTEPFRIPSAGTTNVCCFDKTGTLTAEEYNLVNGKKMNAESSMVLGGCHSIVRSKDNGLIGESLEIAAFRELGYVITPNGRFKNSAHNIDIEKIFHFSAELRRMSTICTVNRERYVLCKGAPETIGNLLSVVPEDYKEQYEKHTKDGARVLALAYKKLSQQVNVAGFERSQAESTLEFAGFAVFFSPFKKGTKDTIAMLLKSTHRCIIITGDDPYTACHVARELNIMDGEPSIDDVTAGTHMCLTGKFVAELNDSKLNEVVQECNVFARMSPDTKELVIRHLGELGYCTMMVGDGSNDVGALKRADIGVGIVEQPMETTVSMDEYQPKLGAASIAAPFVSKRATISACIDLIRFGRSTLSSTTDVFKLLSLNCLISAFSMSVLFVENVKFGDQQMTITGILIALAFMAVSWASPEKELSSERPFDSQFNLYLVLSVLLQCAVHFFAFFYVKGLVDLPAPAFDMDAKFTPSLMNTAMFILSTWMQIVTFVCNYRGKPFMQSLTQNKLLIWSLIISAALVAFLLTGPGKEIEELFELVPFPSADFQLKLTIACILDLVLCYALEKVCLHVFASIHRRKSKALVSDEILDRVAKYTPLNDDVLAEEQHKFGFLDMLKENVNIQKKMALQKVYERERSKQARKGAGRTQKPNRQANMKKRK